MSGDSVVRCVRGVLLGTVTCLLACSEAEFTYRLVVSGPSFADIVDATVDGTPMTLNDDGNALEFVRVYHEDYAQAVGSPLTVVLTASDGEHAFDIEVTDACTQADVGTVVELRANYAFSLSPEFLLESGGRCVGTEGTEGWIN